MAGNIFNSATGYTPGCDSEIHDPNCVPIHYLPNTRNTGQGYTHPNNKNNVVNSNRPGRTNPGMPQPSHLQSCPLSQPYMHHNIANSMALYNTYAQNHMDPNTSLHFQHRVQIRQPILSTHSFQNQTINPIHSQSLQSLPVSSNFYSMMSSNYSGQPTPPHSVPTFAPRVEQFNSYLMSLSPSNSHYQVSAIPVPNIANQTPPTYRAEIPTATMIDTASSNAANFTSISIPYSSASTSELFPSASIAQDLEPSNIELRTANDNNIGQAANIHSTQLQNTDQISASSSNIHIPLSLASDLNILNANISVTVASNIASNTAPISNDQQDSISTLPSALPNTDASPSNITQVSESQTSLSILFEDINSNSDQPNEQSVNSSLSQILTVYPPTSSYSNHPTLSSSSMINESNNSLSTGSKNQQLDSHINEENPHSSIHSLGISQSGPTSFNVAADHPLGADQLSAITEQSTLISQDEQHQIPSHGSAPEISNDSESDGSNSPHPSSDNQSSVNSSPLIENVNIFSSCPSNHPETSGIPQFLYDIANKLETVPENSFNASSTHSLSQLSSNICASNDIVHFSSPWDHDEKRKKAKAFWPVIKEALQLQQVEFAEFIFKPLDRSVHPYQQFFHEYSKFREMIEKWDTVPPETFHEYNQLLIFQLLHMTRAYRYLGSNIFRSTHKAFYHGYDEFMKQITLLHGITYHELHGFLKMGHRYLILYEIMGKRVALLFTTEFFFLELQYLDVPQFKWICEHTKQFIQDLRFEPEFD